MRQRAGGIGGHWPQANLAAGWLSPYFSPDKARDGGEWVTLALWHGAGARRAGRRQGRTHEVQPLLGTPVTSWGATGGLAAYRDGVTVICELAAQFGGRGWAAQTPCAE